jgi:hypothetical protein
VGAISINFKTIIKVEEKKKEIDYIGKEFMIFADRINFNGKSYIFKCIGKRYDGKLVFITDEIVNPYWIKIMGFEMGFSINKLCSTYILGPYKYMICMEEGVCRWFKNAMSNVQLDRIKLVNLKVNIKIAESMMLQDHKNMHTEDINKVLAILKSEGLKMVYEKRKSFIAICESQVNQLPF